MELVELLAGSLISQFCSVQERDVGPMLSKTSEYPHRPLTGGQGPFPSYVRYLYKRACQGCTSDDECLAMAQLLRDYKEVFGSGDHDVGLTQAVRHETILTVGTILIRQLTRRLRPE